MFLIADPKRTLWTLRMVIIDINDNGGDLKINKLVIAML